MFEASITPAIAQTGAPGTLRPLEWSEIVARLGAARDLRAMLNRPIPSGSPSMGSFASRAGSGSGSAADGERDVNHGALGRGKAPTAIIAVTNEDAAGGNQRTQ